MRIAVIWSRFGPYHLARLRAADELGKRNGVTVIGLEVAECDSDYAWHRYRVEPPFQRRTVFPGKSYHALTATRIHAGIRAALDEIRPDAVAINGWSTAEARAALKWCKVRPGIGVIVMSATKEDDARRIWWKEVLKRRLLRKIDTALVGGSRQKEYLVKLGMAPERIFIGYDVIDNDYFCKETQEARANADMLRKQHSLPHNYLLACTRFLPRKNVDGLLIGYAAYRTKSRSPWGLIIAGSGPELPRLRVLERDLGLEGVIWPGFLQYDQLPFYYGLAGAFIHPAKAEAWGLVLNEAAASGLPLIVSNRVGAQYELLKQGENGFHFDPYDPDAICHSLLHFTECSADRRAKMGYCSSVIAKAWGPDRFGRQLLAASRLANSACATAT